MKICITSKGPGKESQLEERFGRAPFFIIFDDVTGELNFIENPLTGTAGGVGPKAVQLLVDNNINTIVTGNIGENALNALNAAGISIVYLKEPITVEQAYEKAKSGL